MSGVRRRVSFVALAWLLSHVTTIGLSLAGLCCNTMAASNASVSDEDECCKGLAPGQMCPLHKHGAHQSKKPASSPLSPGECVMRSACNPALMTLTSLTLDLGLLPDVATLSDRTTLAVVRVETAPTLARISPLDHPPPRA